MASEIKRSLEDLPAELLCLIAAVMPHDDLKQFSTTSNRLRAASLPTLFRTVEFTFSRRGLEELECFTQSAVRKQVVEFKYTVPKLLNQRLFDGPDEHSDERPDDGDADEDFERLYGAVYQCNRTNYDHMRRLCLWQREIRADRTDEAILATALAKMPKISELTVCFDNPKSRLCSWYTTGLDSDKDHIMTVLNAVQAATENGFRPKTLCLSYLPVLQWCKLDYGRRLPAAMAKLVGCFNALGVRGCPMPFYLLAKKVGHLERFWASDVQRVPASFMEGFAEGDPSQNSGCGRGPERVVVLDGNATKVGLRVLGLPSPSPGKPSRALVGPIVSWWVRCSRGVCGQFMYTLLEELGELALG